MKKPFKTIASSALLPLLLALAPGRPAEACHLPEHLRTQEASLTEAQLALLSHGGAKRERIDYDFREIASCNGGAADIFPCHNVDLLAHLPLSEIGGGTGNDIWGWYDVKRDRDYAIVGRSNGTAFVDMTDPENPVFKGNLPTHARRSAWRDIKVYQDHAFIVADFAGAHGMQVFDLAALRKVKGEPVTFEEVAHYDGFDRAHNLVINEDTGFAYAVGSEACGGGGLHMIDISDPRNPVAAGCFAEDGYTHDAQCVVYQGPDPKYRGSEICFASNEDSVTIVDVTDKQEPVMLSRTEYEQTGYTHQGWLTEDHAYFVHDDELDEQMFDHATKTYVWDVSSLENPRLAGTHMADGRAIDHNQYIKGDYSYQANYRRGLRILHLENPAKGRLREVAYFDTYPEADGDSFDGAWTAYPFMKSGVVIVSDINRGLFILRPRIDNVIFADDFESGELGSWSQRKGDALAGVAPGLDGSAGALAVTVDGQEEPSYLASKHPAREKSLTLRLLLNPNQVELGNSSVEILRLVGKKKPVAQLMLEPAGSRYRVSLFALDGEGEPVLIGSTKIRRKRSTLIGLEWTRASSRKGRDGTIVLRKKAKQRRAAFSGDLATGKLVIDAVRIGLPGGAPRGASGSFLLDSYESLP